MPMTRAVLLTKEDLENFQNNAFNRDSVGSLLPLGQTPLPVPAQVPANALQGPPPSWPPPPRRRTRSASTRRQRPAETPTPAPALPAAVTPGNNMVFYSLPKDSLACERSGLSSVKKPSRVVRAKTLSRMDRISPEPPPTAGGSNDGLVLQGHDIRRMQIQPELKAEVAPTIPQRADCVDMVAGLRHFLQVSGQAAMSVPSPAAETSTFEEEWSCSEDDASADSSGEVFDVRRYRYARSPETRSAPDRAVPRHARWRRGLSTSRQTVEGLDEDAFGAWPSVSSDLAFVSARSERLLGDESGSEDEEDESSNRDRDVAELLRRMAKALADFYGLGEAKHATRLKSSVVNVVMVTQEAWKVKERPSQLDEPPMFWLRGGRVYDFHGDRGTVSEFENDLLIREVEDDGICRQRRQKQGLLPFPFLPLPQREKAEEQEEEAKVGPKR